MPSCTIILLAWLEDRVVSLAALLLWNVLYGSLSFVSITGNFTSSVSQIMLLMLWISLAHYFRHSPILSMNIAFSKSGFVFAGSVLNDDVCYK